MVVDPQVYSAFESFPLSADVGPADLPLSLYRGLLERGVRVDVLPAGAELTRYRAVLVPTLFLTDDRTAAAIGQNGWSASVWSEQLQAVEAEVLTRYADGPPAGFGGWFAGTGSRPGCRRSPGIVVS